MFQMSFLAPPIKIKPTVGDIYGIRSSIDGSFNRGSVLEELNENQFKVVFFDLGTEDVVSASSFVEIPKRLKQVSIIFHIYNLTYQF